MNEISSMHTVRAAHLAQAKKALETARRPNCLWDSHAQVQLGELRHIR